MKQNLPLKDYATLNLWLTGIISIMVALVAVFSLENPQMVYTTTELNQAYYPSDIGILLFGIPMMIITLWLVWKGRFMGLLLWPGALFFIIYSYALYLFGIPFGYWTLIYFLIVSLSGFTLYRVLKSVEIAQCRSRFAKKTPTRFASGVLVALGAIILLRTIGLISTAVMQGQRVSQIDIALWMTDLIIAAPALVIVGIQLWKKKDFSYLAAPGLLMQYMVLSLGLLPVFYYQAGGDWAAVDSGDLTVVVFMILLCVIPFIQFVKSINRG